MRRALLLPCLFACLALSGCKADPAIRLHVSGLDADISALRARVSLDGTASRPVEIFNRLAPGGEDLFGPGGQALLGLQLPTAARGEALISLEGITPYRFVLSSGAALPASIDSPSTIDVDLRLDRQRSCNQRRSDGATWCREGPGPLGLTQITHIHGSASDDVWAVGYSGLILHWDGVAWTDRSPTTSQDLYAVWAIGRDDAWAVGDGSMVLHWDGKVWAQALSPSRFEKHLWYGVWAAASNDVWIGGGVPNAAEGPLLHWDGKDFTPYTVVGMMPNRLFGFGSSDIWAVGGANNPPQEKTAHWDGVRWTEVSIPMPAATALQAVWGSGPKDVWAIGPKGVLHREGGQWMRLPDPVDGVSPQGLWGVGKDDVWLASGHTVRHWNGARWQPVTLNERPGDLGTTTWTSPDGEVWIGGLNATIWRQEKGSFRRHVAGEEDRLAHDLYAVWGSGAADVWAAGSGGHLLRYDGVRWAPVPTDTRANLWALWGSGAGDFWVVGDQGMMLHRQGDDLARTVHDVRETLFGVHGTAADDVWVVGSPGVVLHFDGAAWTSMAPTGQTDVNFRGVYAHSRDEVTIVGETMTTPKARVWRWTRGIWMDLSPDYSGDLLLGIAAPSADQLFVLTSNPGKKLLRYQAPRWIEPVTLPLECTQLFGGRSDGPWVACRHSTDLILRWDQQQQRLAQESPLAWGSYNALWGLEGGDLWAVGNAGVIARRLGR